MTHPSSGSHPSKTKETEFNDGIFPSLFRLSDKVSIGKQKAYLRMQKYYLVSLFLCGLISGLSELLPEHLRRGQAIVIAFILGVGFVFILITRIHHNDKAWFDCRALAESVKTITWRYMMNAPPFSQNSGPVDFLSKMREVRNARPGIEKNLTAESTPNVSQDTSQMEQIRETAYQERMPLYIQYRLLDQLNWYSVKAQSNARSGIFWFWVIFSFQAAALILAIVAASSSLVTINPIAILTTAAGAFVAWNQIKRHEELSQTYALAQLELSELHAMAGSVSAKEFPNFVDEAEETISREHTLWCARRNVPASQTK